MTSTALDQVNILNESSDGWVSIILYRRWTGTYAVARVDARKGFIGTVYACTSGIRHAHRYFEKMQKGEL